MTSKFSVTLRTFSAIQRVDVDELLRLTEQEIKPILPCLVRMSLCVPLDQSSDWVNKRQAILKILSGIEAVNSLVALLSIDFHALEIDVKKEQQLRLKLGGLSGESILIQSLRDGLAMDFEHSDAARKLRLLLSELLAIMAQVKENRDFGIRSSELFDNEVYLEEISDVLCIALAELPGLLQMQDVAEALLHVHHGTTLLCRVIANSPDSFKEVCYNLLLNGEKQEEESPNGRVRLQALRALCQMNMSQALAIRAKAVETCRMPGLAVLMTLDYCRQEQGDASDFDSVVGDLVAFVSGLLLGSDDKVRTWFSQYIRNCQKKSEDVSCRTLSPLREELLQRLQNLVLFSIDQHNLPDAKVVQASALLRLYCALRGIAGLKFQEDEINLLLQLLTSHPPASAAGIRFVSLGFCMLLACPSLLVTHDHEKRAVEWIHWLLREEAYFGKLSGMSASFGEMLLLVAIHFHSNQTSSISDLVCSTLGMKVAIRANNLTRMKTIFTQEIFTDQVVTAHAVKVPVTPQLSGNTQGFLPVHCIHQLLKSRAFTKHKVPIKDWIYKQICHTIPPLHPVLPALIQVYVSSVLLPASKSSHDTTNEPISEQEITAVFQNSSLLAPTRATPQDVMNCDNPDSQNVSSLTSQLLLLYYLLLYEDTRLNNVRSILSSNRKVKRYTTQFMSQLPILYLVQQAQRQQQNYGELFAPLLRLLATHYPHLCLVKDWITDDAGLRTNRGDMSYTKTYVKEGSLIRAFQSLLSCPIQFQSKCQQLLQLPAHHLWGHAKPFVDCMPLLLQDGCPRELQEQARDAWLRINSIFPRRLWVMTVNAFHLHQRPYGHSKSLTWDDIVLDPLHVLRCKDAIFRCPPLMEITLHMLRAFLAASRTHLSHHMLEHPLPEKLAAPPALGGVLSATGEAKQLESEKDREELCFTLVATQQSASVQVLLECCLPKPSDMENEGLLTRLREVQSLICSHLHQVFISDPALVKLVQFQGYPSELLPIAVSSIPSMHICLDFIPELLSQPYLEKQVFAVELASYLCIQYAIPKSLNIAKLCINIAHTLLGVLTSERRPSFFLQTLPALVRMCRAFPPLCEDVVCLLLQLGKVCLSHSCVSLPVVPSAQNKDIPKLEITYLQEVQSFMEELPSNNDLCKTIQASFGDLSNIMLLDRTIY